MGAASPSATPIPCPVPLPAFGTIPVGGMSRALDHALAQDTTPLKKPKFESLELAIVHTAAMMEQQAAQMSNMMHISMNASGVAQRSSEHMMKLLIHQLGIREAAVVPLGAPSGGSQVQQPVQQASSLSVTASAETELDEGLQLFINKMASSFEKIDKKYVQAKAI